MVAKVNPFYDVRRFRSAIIEKIYDGLQSRSQTMGGRNQSGSLNLDQKPKQNQSQGDHIILEVSDEATVDVADEYLESELTAEVYNDLKSRTQSGQIEFKIDSCTAKYGVIKSQMWPTSIFFGSMDRIFGALLRSGFNSSHLSEIAEDLEAGLREIRSIDKSKQLIVDLMMLNDADAIETLTEIDIPESREDISRSVDFYGDDFPPLDRGFLAQTSELTVEYSDKNVCLIRSGTPEENYDRSILVGEDDSGFFFHPMQRSLRVDSENYNISKSDIHDLMGYDTDWSEGDDMSANQWHRIQGDLLIKRIPESEIREMYERIAVCDFTDRTLVSEYLDSTALSDVKDLVDIRPVDENGELPSLIFVNNNTESDTISEDIRRIMEFPEDADQIYEVVNQYVNWLGRNYGVNNDAEIKHQKELDDGRETRFATQLDNHLVLLQNACPSPDSQEVYDYFMDDNDDRNFTSFAVEETATISIQHREHNPLNIELPASGYLLTLARRRDR